MLLYDTPSGIPVNDQANWHPGSVRTGVSWHFQIKQFSRELGGRDRVGQFSRGRAWDLVTAFAKRFWAFLLLLMFLPTVVFLPIIFFLEHGAMRWVTVGAVGISGPWLSAIILFVMSGAIDPFLGLDAEGDTAGAFRRLQRRGWKLANGIKIRGRQDIDHVVVGPAGILVVESKWSQHRWPLGDRSRTFMADRLSDAVEQVLQNRKDVSTQFAKAIVGAPIRAVCVVWSTDYLPDDPSWVEYGDALIVRGPALKSWLQTLNENVLDQPGIDRIWNEIELQATRRDKNDRNISGAPRRTVLRVVTESFLLPILGGVLALYGFVGLAHLHQYWLDIAAAVVFPIVGLGGLCIGHLRGIARGWIGTSFGFDLIFLVIVIRDLVR